VLLGLSEANARFDLRGRLQLRGDRGDMELDDATVVAGDSVREIGALGGGGAKDCVSSIIWSGTASVLVGSLISSREIGDPASISTVGFLAPFRKGFLFPLTGDGGGNNWNWLIVIVGAIYVQNSKLVETKSTRQSARTGVFRLTYTPSCQVRSAGS